MPDSVLPGGSMHAIEGQDERTEDESERHGMGVDDVEEPKRQPRANSRVRQVDKHDETRRTGTEIEQFRMHIRERYKHRRKAFGTPPLDGIGTSNMNPERHAAGEMTRPTQRWYGELLMGRRTELRCHGVLATQE
jgi:hypothetical protein